MARLCLHGGCPDFAAGAGSYCDEHRPQRRFRDRYGVSENRWKRLKTLAKRRDLHRCVMCGSPDKLEVDHIEPRSLGGANTLDNLQTLCSDCHLAKTTRERNY